jgi:hypothetical protein
VESGVEQLRQDVLLLDFLEVNLGVAVQPVRDLDDVEELQGEHHAAVRVAGPQGGQVRQQMLSENCNTKLIMTQTKQIRS